MREDQVIQPDGQPGIYGVVETKKAIAVVAINDRQEIYLVGQFRYPVNSYSWEVIEGGCEKGESLLETAKRELREEAGLLAADWQQLGHEIYLSNCFSDEIGIIYLARDLQETSSAPEATEILQIKKIPLAEAYQKLAAGEFQDSLTIIALYRLQAFLARIIHQDL